MFYYRTLITTVAALTIATNGLAAAPIAHPSEGGQSTLTGHPVLSSPAAIPVQSKIDLNKAPLKELMKVKGLTRAKARNIISYRKKHGDFHSLDALSQVRGFTKMQKSELQKIEEQLLIG